MMAQHIFGHWVKIISSILLLISLNCDAQINGIRGFYRQNAKLTADTTTVIRPEALLFITAAGITDITQKNAINRLVMDLKGEVNPNYSTVNIWSKFKAIWPFAGGNATAHKYNLISPIDADASFRLTFQNSPTQNSNGVVFDKTLSQLAFTHFTPTVELDSSSNFFGCYQLQLGGVAGNSIEAMGAEGLGAATYGRFYVGCDWDENGAGNAIWSSANSFYFTQSGTPKGLFVVNKISDIQYFYKNGVLLSTQSQVASLPPYEVYLGAWNQTNIPSYNNSTLAMAFIGSQGLTNLEAIALYNAVQYYEYTLNRQVN